MNKLTTAPGRIPLDAKISALAEGSVFSKLGYKADGSKAYIECEVCHSLPAGRFVGAGGAANGNELGLWADVIAKSHGSLLHQQLNVRHQLAEYADDKRGKQDHIIGCVVATQIVASKPGSALRAPSNHRNAGDLWSHGADVHIAALMVVHKLAKGVNTMLGNHITSREEQSVSIEMQCGIDQLGVMHPETGEAHSFGSMPDEWMNTVQWTNAQGERYAGLPVVGSVGGKRLVVCYGLPGDAIEFQGIATTPNPAENMARITNVLAENDGRTLRIAAERVDEAALPGRSVFYKATGRTGRVQKVLTEGRYYGLRATAENPVLLVHVGRDIVFTELNAACLA